MLIGTQLQLRRALNGAERSKLITAVIKTSPSFRQRGLRNRGLLTMDNTRLAARVLAPTPLKCLILLAIPMALHRIHSLNSRLFSLH